MNVTREAVDAALFAKLGGVAGFVTTARRFRHFADVAPADQPALFLVRRGEQVQRVPGMPPVYLVSYDALLYANTHGDTSVPPSSILNPLLDAVEAALQPDAITNKQTLGGLVQHAWIEGQIETDEGMLQEQGYALIPISVKVV